MVDMIFTAGKKSIGIVDALDFCIWDTARDRDGGEWRERFRQFYSPGSEGKYSYVRTQIPSTILVVARPGMIELHDYTVQQANRGDRNTSLIAELRGPFALDDNISLSAAEGMIAASNGTSLFMFDLALFMTYELNATALYLVNSASPFAGTWSAYEKIAIGTGFDPGTGFGSIVCTRPTDMFTPRPGLKSRRPFVFAEANGDQLVAVRPDLKIIEFTHSGWGLVDSLNALPGGEIIFRAGADAPGRKCLMFKPASWYYSLGTSQAETHANYITAASADLVITGGFDEFGIEDSADGRMAVIDVNARMGGTRIFHEKGCSPKAPGTMAALLCAGATPNDNAVPDGTDATLNGALGQVTTQGLQFFNSWSGTNNISRANGGSDTWATSWAVTMVVDSESASGTEYLMEYGYAPGGYSGSAARLTTVSNVLKFETTTDGWSTVDKTITLGEMPNHPVVIMCGVMTTTNNSTMFLAMEGHIVRKKCSAPTYNASASLSIGVSVDGANPASSFYISNVAVSFDFGPSALDKCVYENIEMFNDLNSVASLRGDRHRLIGGDDEFGVYGVLTDLNLVMFRCGVLTSMTLREMSLDDKTIEKMSMRGWRIGLYYADTTLGDNDIWTAPGTISFTRSDYEQQLTGKSEPVDQGKMKYSVMLRGTEDFIGPLLVVDDTKSAQFFVRAKSYSIDTGFSAIEEGYVVASRINEAAGTATVNEYLAETANTNGTLTVSAHAQGAYIQLPAPGAGLASEWEIEIERL